ncbi:MAG: hypothetical protein NC548_39475 [Lachnospiraceae bacterium]|nr:hypothetical protein [Lachnospiraceae bacterium]
MYPVQMVARTPKLKREKENSGYRHIGNSKAPSFGTVLEQTAKAEYGEEIYLVTYTADKQLQTHYYRQSREYTF